MAAGALDGVRVIEFAQNAAVPQCGRLLAGLGADVVKVEPPEGDAMRHLAKLAPTEARGYATINPGKRAITLDLTSDAAREIIDAALRWADVCLVGLKGSDVARFGLDWERVSGVNSALVHLVFTSFGPEGPDAAEGGYDVLVQGLSGVGFLMNRSEGGAPLPTRPAMFDFASGMIATVGVLAALRHRDATGEGQQVDASLLGTAMSLGTPVLATFAKDAERTAAIQEELSLLAASGVGFDAVRRHYEHEILAGNGMWSLYFRHYMTADGMISIAGLSPGLVRKFHEVTGLPPVELGRRASDPEFAAVIEAAEELFLTRSTDEWLSTLRDAGYPCARYNTPLQSVRDPQVRANDYTVDLEHPDFGEYTTVGMPIALGANETGLRGPSPRLGEHNTEVLAEFGFDAATTERLLSDAPMRPIVPD